MPSKLEQFLTLVPVENFESRYQADIKEDSYFGFPIDPLLKAEQNLVSRATASVAYFSMEYGLSSNTYNAMSSKNPLNPKNSSGDHHVFSNLRAIDYYVSIKTDSRIDLPIYSGGLGVLAGDTLKSSADLAVPMVAIGILWNKGYFKQNFWFKDGQVPEENDWDPYSYPGLVPLKTQVELSLKKEIIRLRLWKYFVYSHDHKSCIPLILLDSNLPQNKPQTQKLTDQLYRSDNADWKLLQRVILGQGGVKALEALGYSIDQFHLNEGHAALAFVEKAKKTDPEKLTELKNHFAYTCHTPVAAGHDRFTKKVFQETLSDDDFALLKKFGQDPVFSDQINLTELAMNTCAHVNAVAQKHGEVTRAQFPQHASKIESITNGVHTHTWVTKPIDALLSAEEKNIGRWKENPCLLKNILILKDNMAFRQNLWAAHQENKKKLCSFLKSWRIEPDVFTICWARRIASYKRPSLILQDPKKLIDLARRIGPIQIILAGKAHPKDDLGFTFVNDILTSIDKLEKERGLLRVVMLENYDTYFGKLLSSSVDVWLNNPLPPFEASGTSGMKAILNGVLQLSTLDGWVVEAADKNVGWIFGWQHPGGEIGDERNLRLSEDSSELYQMLERVIELYYQTNFKGTLNASSDWITKMIHAVSEAGFFNTHRMVEEYRSKIWKL